MILIICENVVLNLYFFPLIGNYRTDIVEKNFKIVMVFIDRYKRVKPNWRKSKCSDNRVRQKFEGQRRMIGKLHKLGSEKPIKVCNIIY